MSGGPAWQPSEPAAPLDAPAPGVGGNLARPKPRRRRSRHPLVMMGLLIGLGIALTGLANRFEVQTNGNGRLVWRVDGLTGGVLVCTPIECWDPHARGVAAQAKAKAQAAAERQAAAAEAEQRAAEKQAGAARLAKARQELALKQEAIRQRAKAEGWALGKVLSHLAEAQLVAEERAGLEPLSLYQNLV